MNKGISNTELNKMAADFSSTEKNLLAMNTANKNGVKSCLRNANLERKMRYSFSLELEAGDITNQKQSGRCWMFAALNTMRVEVMKKLNLKNMELSQNYTLFYDKLEKSNYFYENILDTLDEPTNGRIIAFLLASPIGDGGQWDMLANLVHKYGVVPKEAMPETFDSSATAELNNWLTKKLRENACTLRTAYQEGKTIKELREMKEAMLTVVYRMLCIAFGEPPKKFTWEVRNEKKKFIRISDITPQEFFKKYVDLNLEDYVSIINAPTGDKPYYKSYTIKCLGNVKEGNIVRHLNLPIEEMKKLAIAQMKDGKVVWFGCDVAQFLDRDYGSMDLEGIQPEMLFSTKFPMNKAERLDYGESLMTHAMVFTGVNLDKKDKANRWKVENSWGDTRGKKGFFVMSDEWFSEYMYQVVINKKYLKKEWIKAYESKPIQLEPWDPMGSLA